MFMRRREFRNSVRFSHLGKKFTLKRFSNRLLSKERGGIEKQKYFPVYSDDDTNN